MATYSIKDIETMSGIKAHTIRMWERRHQMVIPKRTDTNIRYYSDEDLKDLLNISILNKNGLKISKIAKLSKDELRQQVTLLLDSSPKYKHAIDALLLSMIEIDEDAFDKAFTEAWQEHGFEDLIQLIIFPFLERIGMLWQTSAITPAQEHFISNLLRQKIIAAIDKELPNDKSERDKIIFFTPEGEMHEFGLLFLSFIARQAGFQVIYLGISIPVADLEEVQRVTNAKAFLSAYVAPIDKAELEKLFSDFRETYPTSPFYVTGLQVRELNPELPNDFYVISSADEMRAALHQLKELN